MKTLIYSILFLMIFNIYGEVAMAKLTDKRVVMVIAEKNFRDEEFFKPKEALENAGVKVDVASSNTKLAKGTLGKTYVPDKLVLDINVSDYDAVIFIGGAGCRQYWKDAKALSVIKEAVVQGKVVGGICSAGATLALAGVLENKKATCFPGEAQILKDNGANYTAKSVEVDGNIITADGPGSAVAFGEALVKKLGE